MKSEPDVYGWEHLVRDKKAPWTGVRNYQARNNLMAMKKGDLCFFYHSNIGKEIVGVMEIVRTHYPDPSDPSGKFVLVDVSPRQRLSQPVSLTRIKAHPALQNIPLIRQARLSVMPVSAAEWKIIMALGNP